MKTYFSILFLLLSTIFHLYSEPLVSEKWGYFLDLPEAAQIVTIEDGGGILAVRDGSEKAFFLLRAMESTTDFDQSIITFKGQSGAEGEESQFIYNGQVAWMAHWKLTTDQGLMDGWWVWVRQGNKVFRVGALVEDTLALDYQDILLSFLDSFSPSLGERYLPGPISQFSVPYPPASRPSNFQTRDLILGEVINKDGAEAEQIVIERESRLLMGYTQGNAVMIEQAWSRFYRMIYREIRPRVEPFAKAYALELRNTTISRALWPQRLLTLLQGFEYKRRGGTSDIDGSQTVLATLAGDCDSLALVYLAVLDHWGTPGILMVSQVYSHAMAALDLQGSGARFGFEGKNYLVAELTADVNLGQIDASQADPAKWLGIDLKKAP